MHVYCMFMVRNEGWDMEVCVQGGCGIPYFFDQTTRLLFFSLLGFVRLLFEDGIYFFRKPADINDGWIRYVQAIQRRCQ